MKQPFKKILVANRSEIAVRVMNACRLLDIPCVAVYSDADANAKHRWYADEAVHIGAPPPRESYLAMEKIIVAALHTGCDAIHPGYGFLAENPVFAQKCGEAGLVFIGPSPEAIRLLGNKVESRIRMASAGVALIPGMKKSDASTDEFVEAAAAAGYPVIIKAAAGGGGKGMRVVHRPEDLKDAIEAARREAGNAFGDDTVYLEKYIVNPRHIEFQVLGDRHGTTVHVFERECSIQRRHQKIIEETPSTALDDELRGRMGAAAVKVAQAAAYTNAGTVEFLLDRDRNFYFLEMNTRVQVEHPVTEMVTGVDLVVEQIRIAAGEPLAEPFRRLTQRGHALECRIYAEDGEANFMPSTGTIVHYSEPAGPGIRVDSGVVEGTEITIDYDPIMAKLIVHAPTRELAVRKMVRALNEYKLLGVKTSKRFMIDVLQHPEFEAGRTYTNFIEAHMQERSIDTALYRDPAIAAAAAAAAGAAGESRTAARGKREMPSAAELIGAWEIGGSIR
ncbi:MAG TPA: acetyl-CoA carboxylase biotin carboxylase subunit [candidate division Zixibacteria bacterium]|nr:acetyl-CoA carboxylase biotin carboxylase subunit [candidate division Zixibacteria bacterium]HPM37156.1 acetyl-CoA carboxylase biotin carboxylase subunit [candidate division Zixibacteria bacterium]